jgi:hypothetical protein
VGFQSTWVQLACSGNYGAVGTFASAGTPILTGPISAFGQVASSCGPGLNVTVLCTNASTFTANDYIMVNAGGGTMEVCRIQSVGSSSLVVDGMNFAHYAGESIYTNGRLFYAQITVPINQFGGIPSTIYELGFQIRAAKVSRL